MMCATMASRLLLVLVLCGLSLHSVHCSDGKIRRPKSGGPLSPGLLCAGCRATLKELGKVVEARRAKDTVQNIVLNALVTICDEQNFNVYNFIPPSMVNACKHFTTKYVGTFYEPFVQHQTDKASHKTIVDDICNVRTGLCEGVDDFKGSDKGNQFEDMKPPQGARGENVITSDPVRARSDEL